MIGVTLGLNWSLVTHSIPLADSSDKCGSTNKAREMLFCPLRHPHWKTKRDFNDNYGSTCGANRSGRQPNLQVQPRNKTWKEMFPEANGNTSPSVSLSVASDTWKFEQVMFG